MADILTPFEVGARRVLSDGSPDPCYDPGNAGTAYCLTRQVNTSGTPETPAEWNARTAQGGLPVTVSKGLSDWRVWAAVAAVAAAVLYARR